MTRAAISVLLVAVLAALVIPFEMFGVNLFMVALAAGIAVAYTQRFQLKAEQYAWALGGLALITVAVFRTSPWIIQFDLLMAAGLASFALAGGKDWFEIGFGGVAVLTRLHKAPAFILARGSRSGVSGRMRSAARGSLLGFGLLMVFGVLFAAADAAFARIASGLLPDIELGEIGFRMFVLVVVAIFTGAFVVLPNDVPRLSWTNPVQSQMQTLPFQGFARLEWQIALGLLNVLFLAFVLVQVTVLFGGHSHVLQTAGLTYAEYARQGFAQLLVASLLVIAVIAGALKWGRVETRLDRTVLRILLGVLCGTTIFILISAVRRLGLYEQAFGFTRARITGHAISLWLGGLFMILILAGSMDITAVLPRIVLAYSLGALLIFSFVGPDSFIAAKNIERYQRTGKIDLGYMAGLSEDAVPQLSKLPMDLRSCVMADYRTEEEPWISFNFARHRALALIREAKTYPSTLQVCGSIEEAFKRN